MANILQVGIKALKPTWLLLHVPGVASSKHQLLLLPRSSGSSFNIPVVFNGMSVRSKQHSKCSGGKAAKGYKSTRRFMSCIHVDGLILQFSCRQNCGIWITFCANRVDDGNGHNHNHWVSTLFKQWNRLNTYVFKIRIENRHYFSTDYFNEWGL